LANSVFHISICSIMSVVTCLKSKALLLIAMLAIVDARRLQEVRSSPAFGSQSPAESTARTAFQPIKALANILLARDPSAAFRPPNVAVHALTGKATLAATLAAPRPALLDSRFGHGHRAGTPMQSMSPVISLRGGAESATTALAAIFSMPSTPAALFNGWFFGLACMAVLLKVASRDPSGSSDSPKPASVRALQLRFLPVFWLLRMSDWLQGPYFYEVYSSKIFGGQKASLDLVSKLWITGFGVTALLGPTVGRLVDQYGRKLGTLAFTLIYAVGALSTKSPLLWVLLLGRIAGGIGTSLLFSAPEAWLVGDAQRVGAADYLGGIFGAAYAGDAIVAITAGQIAERAARIRGPSGPFEVSTLFLAAGAVVAAALWRENKAVTSASASESQAGPTIKEAFDMVLADKKMMLVGAVQALFEGAMYIFVLQWPPVIAAAIAGVFGGSAVTPFGTVFSCFMVCCLLGSTLFGAISKKGVRTEVSTLAMLLAATAAMAAACAGAALGPLVPVVAAFFVFEACVGMYFPSIGTLRSKYLPDSHRSVIMNLNAIPLNVLVVSVFLSIKKLGVTGALGIATGALGLSAVSMSALIGMSQSKEQEGEKVPAEEADKVIA